jgi:hypothetical protein
MLIPQIKIKAFVGNKKFFISLYLKILIYKIEFKVIVGHFQH